MSVQLGYGPSNIMALDRRKVALFGTSALLRILLFTFIPSLPDLLAGRVELSTPVTSFKRCNAIHSLALGLHLPLIADRSGCDLVQEGVFLYTHNVSPYNGGVFHQVGELFCKSKLQSLIS